MHSLTLKSIKAIKAVMQMYGSAFQNFLSHLVLRLVNIVLDKEFFLYV